MLELDRLRAFVTVAGTSSVTRAAQLLHISQSPLSRQIKALEDSLGFALFTREKKRLRLTRSGSAFLSEAESLLRAAATVERRALALRRGDAGHLTIGYVAGAIYAGVLIDELKALRRRAPAVTIELRELRSAAQVKALEIGEIDVGYSYAPGGSLVAREPFVLAAPSSVKSERARELLGAMPLITLPEATSPIARAEMVSACARVAKQPSVCIEAADPAVVLALVEAGLGVGVLQSGLQQRGVKGVRFVRLPPAFGLEVRIFRRERTVTPDAPRVARRNDRASAAR